MTTSKELPGSVWYDEKCSIAYPFTERQNGDVEYVLIDRVQKLVEALKFYGNARNYDTSIGGNCPMHDDADNYPENARFGKRAREALAESGNVRGEEK